jgi:hypothetical protein
MQETEDSTANTNKDVDALYKCEPVYWKNKLSKPMRMIAGYVVALVRRCCCFLLFFLVTIHLK